MEREKEDKAATCIKCLHSNLTLLPTDFDQWIPLNSGNRITILSRFWGHMFGEKNCFTFIHFYFLNCVGEVPGAGQSSQVMTSWNLLQVFPGKVVDKKKVHHNFCFFFFWFEHYVYGIGTRWQFNAT